MENDTLTIGGKDFDIIRTKLMQKDLKFYPENPRIYSIVFNGDDSPDQNEIEKKLIDTDHVKQLSQSIKANGGLIDPILVRSGDNLVLEGNCRLAAYRLLSKADPIRWGEVKCNLLPSDIDDDSIFKLLGQYHIIGRKDWAPFEQAGYLWRRKTNSNVDESNMANEMGISLSKIKRLIKIYQFMYEQNDLNSQNWSYYEEYFKSSILKEKREILPELDEIVVKKIKTGEFYKSNTDIRNLAKVARLPGNDGKRLLKKFINEDQNLDELLEVAELKGADNTFLRKLNNFRVLICNPELNRTINNMPIEQLSQSEYELKKIEKRSNKLLIKVSKQKKNEKKFNKKTHVVETNDIIEERIEIKTNLIPQFSNFNDGTNGIVEILQLKSNCGLPFEEIGKHLTKTDNKKEAHRKYGENHAKFAEQLGLVTIDSSSPRKVFATDLGLVFIKSSNDKKKLILIDQILKMPIMIDLGSKNYNDYNLLEYLKKFLSESTARRRYSNIKKIIEFLAENDVKGFRKVYQLL